MRRRDERALAELEARLGHVFINRQLLRVAMTHRSITNETSETEHNERLEFLGDAVLELIVSQLLFEHYPGADEGELSRLRASAVNREALAEKARSLELGLALRLGEGERRSGGATKDSLLADAFEAVVAAIHMDAGFDHAYAFVSRLFSSEVPELEKKMRDPKTELQHWCQRAHKRVPTYKIVAENGPEHDRTFVCEVTLDEAVLGVGSGRSKKVAEIAAAAAALAKQQGSEA